MKIFAWEDRNEAHIAKHGVTPGEAEYVARAARQPYPLRQGVKWLVRGPTPAGRWLQVIYVHRDVATIDLDWIDEKDRLSLADVKEVGYVIHARELTEAERRRTRRD